MKRLTRSPVIERLLLSLAEEVGYPLSSHEIQDYIKHCDHYSLSVIARTILEFKDDAQSFNRVFPSIAYFTDNLEKQCG